MSIRNKLLENILSATLSGGGAGALANRINVTQASDMAGALDSTKEYFIDGIVDMGTQTIEVPAGGLYFAGYNFDTSLLFSTADNYTMFTSPIGGSGNVLGKAVAISTNGISSQVYNIKSLTGFEAIEMALVNYNNCTSLGTIDNYRQGLEEGTGRFGGSPSLTLKGTWAGGFRITTSITRMMSDTTTEPLFKAGVGLTMGSRFLTDMNVDLGSLQPFADFTPANFDKPSALQVIGAIITRDGVSDSADTNIFPNISETDVKSKFQNNNGLPNTFVGGIMAVTTAASTTISTAGAFVDIAGTFTATSLTHFDETVNAQLKHIGEDPIEFRTMASITVDGPANNSVSIRVKRWNSADSVFEFLPAQTRQINSFLGGRDVGFFAVLNNVKLRQNDYVQLQIANNSGTGNLSVDVGSFITVDER